MAAQTGTDFTFVHTSTIKPLPNFAVGQLNCRAGTFTVQPILPSDVPNLVAFCKKGKFFNQEMDRYIQASLNEHPLSIYTVRSRTQEIQAILCLRINGETGKLFMRVFVDKTQRQKQLGTAIWSWTVEQLFPMLVQNKLQIGDRSFLESNLVLKNLPDFLASKAETSGFTHLAKAKTHTIALRQLVKAAPPQQEEKGANAAPPSAADSKTSWLGSWWS